jgi:hypothetical protein
MIEVNSEIDYMRKKRIFTWKKITFDFSCEYCYIQFEI